MFFNLHIPVFLELMLIMYKINCNKLFCKSELIFEYQFISFILVFEIGKIAMKIYYNYYFYNSTHVIDDITNKLK